MIFPSSDTTPVVTAEQIRATYPAFYGNRAIKTLAGASRWTISGVLGDPGSQAKNSTFHKARKAPIDVQCLLTEHRVRGAYAFDETCLVTLDELTTRLPIAANNAFYLRMQLDGLLMVDIEPDCPPEIASALLRMPRIIYAETSMSGRGYHLLMRAPTNLSQFPDVARKRVLREEHGWYELLFEHWVTFTRQPIPIQRITEAHAHSAGPDDPRNLEDLFATLAATASTKALSDASAVRTGATMPQIPHAERIITGIITSATGHLKEPEDFHSDMSRYEFSVMGSLYGWLRSQVIQAAAITTHVYSDSDLAWLLYAATQRMIPARPKHREIRNNRPYLLNQAAALVADRRADEEALMTHEG